jgi:DNA-binding CsgD family transcriptional regulator
MLVFGTQIHIVTFVFIVLEFCMLIFQLARTFYQPHDRHNGWYMLLLGFLIVYNTVSGLFPDPKISLPIRIQEMMVYGSGFLTASYLPFYFYKAFDLKSLRWHALFGVPLFILLPYFVFIVVVYSINDHLEVDLRYALVAPFLYSFELLRVILIAISRRYTENRRRHLFLEETALYFALCPWAAMAVLCWFGAGQLVETFTANTGVVIITTMYFWKSTRQAREEFKKGQGLTIDGMSPQLFQANCLYFGLTKTEILIVQRLYKGMKNSEIAEAMFISQETVKKHIQNAFKKTGIKNRAALIHKLQNHRS